MKNILAASNLEILTQYAWANALVALDYDGTLAPIVDDPDAAEMRPKTRRALSNLTALYRTVVISGRVQLDIRKRLRGVGVHSIVGTHGLEERSATDQLARMVQGWVSTLRGRLISLKGVHVENKTYSLAVHYRRSREKKLARATILDATARLGAARVIFGKQVVNVLPPGAPHKGMALERERARLRCDTAIYIGDDQTDEDVFALDQPGRLLSIRVGLRKNSAANYYIPRQADIDELFRVLVDLRRQSTARAGV